MELDSVEKSKAIYPNVDKELSWEEMLESAIALFKKAVSKYNDLLNSERVEDFIIYFHISLNRLIITYFKKIGKKHLIFKENGMVNSFETLINSLAATKFFEKNELEYFRKLNELRNALFHYVMSGNRLLISTRWYKFFNGLIILWEKLKMELDGNFLMENILVLSTFNLVGDEFGENNFYLEKLREIEKNPTYEQAEVLVAKFHHLQIPAIGIEQNVDFINDSLYGFEQLILELKKKFVGFNRYHLICMNSVFSIKSNKNYVANIILSQDEKNAIVKYRPKYLEKLVQIIGTEPSYKKLFSILYKRKELFEIDNFSWNDPRLAPIREG